jgi:hypothetical protein
MQSLLFVRRATNRTHLWTSTNVVGEAWNKGTHFALTCLSESDSSKAHKDIGFLFKILDLRYPCDVVAQITGWVVF